MPSVRPRRRVARDVAFRALLVAALSLFAFHEAFHFADWLDWGLGMGTLVVARDALWPFFGAHNTFGYVMHAIVNLSVLLALGWAFIQSQRKGGLAF